MYTDPNFQGVFDTPTAFDDGIHHPQPYLEGNFAPVEDELTVDDLPVVGQLPTELAGMFIRNGPNPRWAPIGRYHWFDGDGMLHGIRIQNGRASYRNRYVRTIGLGMEDAAGHAIWSSLMDPIQPDVPEQSAMIRWKKNVANTALAWHAGRLLALWDTGEPYEISVPDLGTIGPHTFHGKLTFPVASHSKIDAATGELLLLGNVMKSRATVHIGVVNRRGELDRVTTVALPRAVYMHDFAITENHVVLYDLPMTYSLERSRRGESPYHFDASLPCRFGIVPRHGDSVRWFDIGPCYISHTMNAYEENGKLVVVALRMASFALGHDAGPIYRDPPRLHRWHLDLETGAVTEEALNDLPVEFPVTSPDRVGRKARYGYAVRLAAGGDPLMDALVKYDLREGTTWVHELGAPDGAGRYCGDPELVARNGATEEDDGWILFLSYDASENRSELIVLDARHVTAPPVARVLLPRRVPHGVHSIWVPV